MGFLLSKEGMRTLGGAIVVLGVFVLIAFGASFFRGEPSDKERGDFSIPPTSEEQQRILEELHAPRAAGELTDGQRRRILDELSLPRAVGTLTDEDRGTVLDMLILPK